MYNSLHSGDAGDCVASLPICKALGEVNFLVDDRPVTKSILAPHRFNSIKPLIESQPYITKFDRHRGEHIDYDFSTFRDGGLEYGKNLMELQASWVKVPVTDDPWMELEPDHAFDGAIIINRSPRHNNPWFPWEKLIDHFEKDIVFVGLREEHEALQRFTGRTLRYHPTSDLLQVGRMIAASKLFIGNQSCALNIAIALGKRFVCEFSIAAADVIYKRPESFYVPDGMIENLVVEGYEPFNSPVSLPDQEIDITVTPPGGKWIVRSSDGTEHTDINGRKLISKANEYEKARNLPLTTIRELTRQSLERWPRWNRSSYANYVTDRANAIRGFVARKNAG